MTVVVVYAKMKKQKMRAKEKVIVKGNERQMDADCTAENGLKRFEVSQNGWKKLDQKQSTRYWINVQTALKPSIKSSNEMKATNLLPKVNLCLVFRVIVVEVKCRQKHEWQSNASKQQTMCLPASDAQSDASHSKKSKKTQFADTPKHRSVRSQHTMKKQKVVGLENHFAGRIEENSARFGRKDKDTAWIKLKSQCDKIASSETEIFNDLFFDGVFMGFLWMREAMFKDGRPNRQVWWMILRWSEMRLKVLSWWSGKEEEEKEEEEVKAIRPNPASEEVKGER